MQRYVHGSNTDDPLIWYDGAAVSSATRRSLQADYHGSIDSVADGSGNEIGINLYDEYGRPAANNIGRFQYTGQAWMPELGLYYYKARMYDPRLGRFLQTDPVGYTDDLDLYAYVGNDPMDHTDPTGEATTCVTDSGGHKQCTMTADTFNAERSNHQTSVPSAAVRAAAEAGKSKVAVHDGFQKKLGFIVKGSGGKPVVQIASDTKTADTSTGSTASAKIPAGALAVIHGHIDSGPDRSDGMVDDPSSNNKLGDSQPLKAGLPNATVSQDEIGWHQIVNGQLQFTFPGGALTSDQASAMQQNLNEEQLQFQVP